MASNINAAQSYATQQAALLKQQLASYYDNLTGAKTAEETAAATRKQQLLDVIANNQNKLDTTYATNTKGAYTNKMLGEQTVSNQLERLGLADQGYGVTQKMQPGLDYGKQLATLGTSYQQGTADIGLDRSGAESDYNASLAEIAGNYSTNKLALDKYVGTATQDVYDKSYNNYIEDQQYQDAMKQQAFENSITRHNTYTPDPPKPTKPQSYTNQAFNPADYGGYTAVVSGKNVIYTTATGNKYTLPVGVNPYGAAPNKDAMVKGVVDKTKVFSNGYQPNNYKGSKLSSGHGTVGSIFPNANLTGSVTGISLANQSVWKDTKGRYLIWDGGIGKYMDVTEQYNDARGGPRK